MKYLLDTHAFIWLDNDPDRLSARVAAICQDRSQELLFSVASAWEMQIKLQLGKLELPLPLAEMVEAQQAANAIRLLPVELAHVLQMAFLPDYHKDPFDRILVAQARAEGATLISADPQIARYPVPIVW